MLILVHLATGKYRDKYTRPVLESFLESLVRANVAYLVEHRQTPSLYDSGVVYAREDPREVFRDVPHVILDGWGDCDDLAAWRAAEYRLRGVAAKVRLVKSKGTVGVAWHAVVQLPDGKREDPSRRLGMGSPHPRHAPRCSRFDSGCDPRKGPEKNG
jgi:hypothetical protein